MTTTEDFVQCVVCQGIVNQVCRCSCGYADPVADERLNQPSGISGQLQQTDAADRLNEPFGDSEQLAPPDAGCGGDVPFAWTWISRDGERNVTTCARHARQMASEDGCVVQAITPQMLAARQPVGVEPAFFANRWEMEHGTADGLVAMRAGKHGKIKDFFTAPLYTAPPAQADRMAIKMLVAAGFVSEDKANESLRIAHGFGGDLGQPAPAAVPAPDLSRTIAQLNRMRIMLRNAKAYVENFTCKSALPPIQQKMIGQIDEVLGALAHAWPATAPMDGPLSGKYADVLRPFVAMMERELHANAGKGDRPGWLSMDSSTALLEIYHHMGKLQRATKNADEPGIAEHAADVANMAMMLVDVCGLLPVDATHPQPAASNGVPELFVQWLEREMPAGTIIGKPAWWAPKLARALRSAERGVLGGCNG